ncbi:hypothetical protein phytr_6440 [Candidatus Phycorickettsia trachydisci]|uniref:tRNA (guanine-N(7)-)-methyltransferase n=1 Tax=Candidatus Phycorickettsia trachydisci TaxID=2115978 RepID=A0A2P1P8L4_9RICK|nr:tRNA (guanosine(46)-N7)-methyltransferase TrmB [Candidatus Phycorickettsia trachydisci]AVP87585.1 hypothetical protein phytr_6440 [Candidatus Phycorickettsia trachydisci]
MRKIKSYARTVGKGLSNLCQSLIQNILPKYQIDKEKLTSLPNLHIEIGFGSGDFIYNMALANPHQNFLGIEVYMNGVCNLLKLCQKQPLDNLFIYPGDADHILESLPNNFVDAFYVFFPDPWPKKRHNKRRLVNKNRLSIFFTKLKDSGIFKFVTDIKDYFDQVIEDVGEQSLLHKKEIFNFNNKIIVKKTNKADKMSLDQPLDIKIQTQQLYFTKYCNKALKEGRSVFSLVGHKITPSIDNLRLKNA